MTAALLAMLLAAPPVEVTFTVRENLAGRVEAARLARAAPAGPWLIADLRDVEVRSGRFVLPGPPGVESIVIVRVREHPGYLLHGPLPWPAEPATREIDSEWRRTVRGRRPSSGDLAWVSEREAPHVLCEWTLPESWECLGVPRSMPGVVVRKDRAGLYYSIVGAIGPRKDVEEVQTASAAWGRLLVIEDARGHDARHGPVRARALRPYRPPARPGATRVEVVPDTRVHVEPVGATALWVTGDGPVAETWLDLSAHDVGAARVELGELAAGPPQAPFPVALETPVAVFGRVTGPMAAPVPDAIVSLYRSGGEVRSADKRKPRRERIAVGEQRTDDDGLFVFANLLPEQYELLAVHSAYGRAVKIVGPHTGEVQVRLAPPPIVEGRVVRDGVPQANVAVVFVPDLAAFAAADDPTELRGGETESDADGRFRLFAASAGTGELKIGSRPAGIKRVPLPAADALPPVTHLGDIELDSGPVLTIVFEDAEECEPILTGPVGRTGLTVVRAKRLGPAMFTAALPEPGLWNVVALCGARERVVAPSAVEVKSEPREHTMLVRWP